MKKMTKNYLFDKIFLKDVEYFSRKLKKLVSRYTCKIDKKIRKAIFYFLFPGGKRIRPVFMFACGKMLGIRKENLIYPACSIELIHNYSLIHDDLPSMDDDDYRRGKLTLHKKFGEANAILVGDGLLTLSFEILADWKEKCEKVIKVIKIISEYSGIKGLIEGQVMDLNVDKKIFSIRYLKEMYIKKTARLIQASLLIPGILKNLSNKKLKILKKIGENTGLLFQVTDDLIDYTSGQDKDKLSYPNLFSAEDTNKIIKKILKQTDDYIVKHFSGAEFEYLRFLIHKIATRTD